MDALSYVLAANRVTGMVAMQLRARGNWGLAGDGIHDAAFLVVAQGTCIGRVGRLYIGDDSSGTVWVGGETSILIEGTLTL